MATNTQNLQFPWSGDDAQQGTRPTMEDSHIKIDNIEKTLDQMGLPKIPNLEGYYAVHDGHGGSEIALALERTLMPSIFKTSEFAQESGSTAVAVLLEKSTIFGANLGDAEAVLGRQEDPNKITPVVLQKNHKPTDTEEEKRIVEAGGQVIWGRVLGSLAVARSFGDYDFKFPQNKAKADFVSAVPYEIAVPRSPKDAFMVVSCDGLWEKLSYETCMALVFHNWQQGRTPTAVAEKMVQVALHNGSKDNVTGIVVYLRAPDHFSVTVAEVPPSATDKLQQVKDVLTEAYANSQRYPSIRDPKDRHTFFSSTISAQVDWFAQHGVIWAAGSDNTITSAALCLPPKKSLDKLGFVKEISAKTQGFVGAEEYKRELEAFEKIWKKHIGDSGHTLYSWGTHPKFHRCGYGEVVLAPLISACNENSKFTLTCFSPEKFTSALLCQKFDFKVLKEVKDKMPGHLLRYSKPKKGKAHTFQRNTLKQPEKCALCDGPTFGSYQQASQCLFCDVLVHRDCVTQSQEHIKCGGAKGKWSVLKKSK